MYMYMYMYMWKSPQATIRSDFRLRLILSPIKTTIIKIYKNKYIPQQSFSRSSTLDISLLLSFNIFHQKRILRCCWNEYDSWSNNNTYENCFMFRPKIDFVQVFYFIFDRISVFIFNFIISFWFDEQRCNWIFAKIAFAVFNILCLVRLYSREIRYLFFFLLQQ